MLDARETAPASATPRHYLDKNGELDRDRSENGPWSAGIPGLACRAGAPGRSKYGRLPLQTTLAPAIRIAREGFPVYARMAKGYGSRREGDGALSRHARGLPAPTASRSQEGEMLPAARPRAHARTAGGQGLRRFLSRRNRAKSCCGRERPKAVTGPRRSWPATRSSEREPIRFEYRGWKIATAPPPSSGGIALAEMLQILEGWDLPKLDERASHAPGRRSDAPRLSATARSSSAIRISSKIPQRVLTSRDYAAGLRATIHPDKATPSDLLSGQARRRWKTKRPRTSPSSTPKATASPARRR